MEGGRGLVAGRVGVVGAQDQGRLEGVQPRGQREGHAGAGGDQRVGRQGGSQQAGRGKCVESALDEQQGVDAGDRGSGSQKPPRALREPGARPLKVRPSGAGRVPTSSAPTGWPPASRHRKTAFWRASAYSRPWRWQSSSEVVGEAALGAQEIAHGRPEALVGWRQAELGARRGRGRRGRLRRAGRRCSVLGIRRPRGSGSHARA